MSVDLRVAPHGIVSWHSTGLRVYIEPLGPQLACHPGLCLESYPRLAYERVQR